MAKVLLVDDAPDILLLVRTLLSVEPELQIVGEAATPAEAIELAETLRPDIVILDQGFGEDISGLEAAPLIMKAAPGTKIVLFTAFHDIKGLSATDSIKEYVLKTDAHKLVDVVLRLLS